MSTGTYRAVILTAMAEALRAAGFGKNGSKFTRSLNDVIQLVSFQSSVSSTASSLRATVNLAIWVPALAGDHARPDVASSHWRRRIGELLPGHCDHWWTVSTEQQAEVAAAEVRDAIQTLCLPTFDVLATTAALARLWQSGASPELTERLAQRYLQRLNQTSGIGGIG